MTRYLCIKCRMGAGSGRDDAQSPASYNCHSCGRKGTMYPAEPVELFFKAASKLDHIKTVIAAEKFDISAQEAEHPYKLVQRLIHELRNEKRIVKDREFKLSMHENCAVNYECKCGECDKTFLGEKEQHTCVKCLLEKLKTAQRDLLVKNNELENVGRN